MDGEWEKPLIPNLKYEVRGSLLPRGVRNKTRDVTFNLQIRSQNPVVIPHLLLKTVASSGLCLPGERGLVKVNAGSRGPDSPRR